MDHGRFAALTRVTASMRSRRGVLATLLGILVLLVGRALSVGETDRGLAGDNRGREKKAEAEGKRAGGRPGGKRHGRNRGNGRHRRRRRRHDEKGDKPAATPIATPIALNDDLLEIT